jgi:predicted DNA-binding protein
MDMHAMSVRFPKDLYERLRRQAFDDHRPMSEIIVEALDAHLMPPKTRKKKETRDATSA